MNDSPTHLLLFDLGGVIIEYTGLQDIHGVLSRQLTPEETSDLFRRTADVWSAFECGQLPPEAFAARFAEHWPLAVSSTDFLGEFERWTRRLLPGAPELLAALRPHFRLAALSNANELHWRRNAALGVPHHFERVFASHEIGVRKPKPEAYQHVLTEMGVLPSEVTFFDDLQVNVDGARQVGMSAYRVEGIDELRACLVELGYLPG